MKRLAKMPMGDKLALALSVVALVVSIWSVVEGQRASRQARWSAFHTSTLATLDRSRATYSYVTCLLRTTNAQRGLPELAQFKANLDNLESSVSLLNDASEATLTKFEALLDASRTSFNRLNDAARAFKNNLSSEELSRVASVCGNEG